MLRWLDNDMNSVTRCHSLYCRVIIIIIIIIIASTLQESLILALKCRKWERVSATLNIIDIWRQATLDRCCLVSCVT